MMFNMNQIQYILIVYLLLIVSKRTDAGPDFIDSMSKQFFGGSNDNGRQHNQQRQEDNPFAQMFGLPNQQVPSRQPPQPSHSHNKPHYKRQPPHRQGYYIPPHGAHYPPPEVLHHVTHKPPGHHRYPAYNGPPPVYGQQQGFGQINPDSNDTTTEDDKKDEQGHHRIPVTHVHARQHEYAIQHYPQHEAVKYHQQHPTVVEYHAPHPEEYHQVHHPTVIEEHHGPSIEIHSDPHHHPHHEVPAHVEYHHPPEIEHHHHHKHKPKRFQLTLSQPSPDYKVIDKHLKIPPVKFRFHFNPKISITTNTKDPLDKKHHHEDDYDLEPYPPPDAFIDHEAPPSYNEHVVEHYDSKYYFHEPPHGATKHIPIPHGVVKHHPVPQDALHHHPIPHEILKHYPVGQEVSKYPVEYPEAKHHVIGHPTAEHHAHPQQFVYDLSRGHTHVNPHRSGKYEPFFKVRTKPVIFTESPPTRGTTTTTTRRPTPSTARTTTTTARSRSRTRARLSARNPGFSVAFTQASSSDTTPIGRSESTTASTATSVFSSNSEREREGRGISARNDEQSSTSAATSISSSAITTTATATTPKSITTTTTTKPTTARTTPEATTTTTTSKPITTSTPTTTTQRTTATSTTQSTTTTTRMPTSRQTPAEETTVRTTTGANDGDNEIEMKQSTDPPRRRPEPLQVERSESIDIIESSESVKVIETTMVIDGKNQTVRFYYITQPVKLPLDVFQKMTGQNKLSSTGMSVIKLRDKRSLMNINDLEYIENL